MIEIKYEQTWCEYLTDCPCGKKEYGSECVKVGSWECDTCSCNVIDDHINKIVVCKGDDKRDNNKYMYMIV